MMLPGQRLHQGAVQRQNGGIREDFFAASGGKPRRLMALGLSIPAYPQPTWVARSWS